MSAPAFSENAMNSRAILLLAIVYVLSHPSMATAGLFDESEKLKGHVVIEAGEMEKLDCPLYGDYDCLIWPSNLYRLGHLCFSISGYVSGYNLIGILGTNEYKVTSVFVVEGGIGSPKVTKHSMVLYECPDMY